MANDVLIKAIELVKYAISSSQNSMLKCLQSPIWPNSDSVPQGNLAISDDISQQIPLYNYGPLHCASCFLSYFFRIFQILL